MNRHIKRVAVTDLMSMNDALDSKKEPEMNRR